MTPRAARQGRGTVRKPLYPRLLRLRHIAPNAWQRAVLGEGAIAVGVLLAMADVASAWTIVALPVAVAAVVKAHDVLQGLLEKPPADRSRRWKARTAGADARGSGPRRRSRGRNGRTTRADADGAGPRGGRRRRRRGRA